MTLTEEEKRKYGRILKRLIFRDFAVMHHLSYQEIYELLERLKT